MEIIYCCYGGSHTSVTAAALHLGLLSRERRPSVREILALPHFDCLPAADLGRVFRYGRDAANNNIYIASLGPDRKATSSALRLFFVAAGLDEEKLLIVDALQCVTTPIRVGGFLSRRLGLICLGRPLCAYGIVMNFACFQSLWERVAVARKVGIDAPS